MIFPGGFGAGGPDLDKDRIPGWKPHWDWSPAWSRRFGAVELRVDNRYRVRIEQPDEPGPVRKAYAILFRSPAKVVLSGEARPAAPELGLLEVEVESDDPLAAIATAALQRTGATLGRRWLMLNLAYQPLDSTGEAFREGIYIAEVEGLLDNIPDEAYTRRTVLVRDLLAMVRRRYYAVAEPMLLSIDRYLQYRATEDKEQQEHTEEVAT